LINGVPLRVPIEILRAYSHCLETSQEFSFTYCIESHCVDWLAQHLQPGDVFLDVGAAYGVISIPLASLVGSTGHIYAFEPARQTRNSLQQIIDGNHLENITVVPLAIADEVGEAEFIEYSTDNRFSWAADTSTLAKDVEPSLDNYSTYAVEITTLDKFVLEKNIRPKAIKIDIEGFELYALQGGMETLKTCKPYLCIDIHQDVKTKKSALLGVKPLLESLGYRCDTDGHTLFASPPA
jgi:FkbM family methyltransferase